MKKNIEVPTLARVEGEGGLYIRLKDGEIVNVEVNIYEPPRFLRAFCRAAISRRCPTSLLASAASAR